MVNKDVYYMPLLRHDSSPKCYIKCWQDKKRETTRKQKMLLLVNSVTERKVYGREPIVRSSEQSLHAVKLN